MRNILLFVFIDNTALTHCGLTLQWTVCLNNKTLNWPDVSMSPCPLIRLYNTLLRTLLKSQNSESALKLGLYCNAFSQTNKNIKKYKSFSRPYISQEYLKKLLFYRKSNPIPPCVCYLSRCCMQTHWLKYDSLIIQNLKIRSVENRHIFNSKEMKN